MHTKHLPPTFTWQGYLDWCEEISPDASFEEAKKVFDMAATRGYIRPTHIDDDGAFVYELDPTVKDQQRVVAIIVQRGGAFEGYKPERDE